MNINGRERIFTIYLLNEKLNFTNLCIEFQLIVFFFATVNE